MCNGISFIKRRYKLSLIILVILIACCGTFVYVKSKNTSKSTTYTEYTVRKGSIDVTVSGTGSITSSYRQDLSPNVAGTVTAVYFNEGDNVKQGDLLFQLDDSTASANVKRTKLSIEQSQSDLESARESIRNLLVSAPIKGQISNLTISNGDSINKGQEICTVTDVSRLKLTVPFNGSQAKDFYVGQEVLVYLQDYMDTVTGEITYISNYGKVVSGGGSTYDVEISI
jgi:HlyD family secretion protein